MYCLNGNDNNSCGKCTYNLLSLNYIYNIPLTKVSRIATNISWMQEFNESTNTVNAIKSVNITCTNSISIVKIDNTNRSIDISMAKYICIKLFKNWYQYHKDSKKLNSYNYIKDKLKLISEVCSIAKMRIILLSIAKHIESVSTCEGKCSTVVPDKEIGNCKFPLSDINKIARFSSDGIVDMFNTMLYTVKDLAGVNLTINFDKTYVTCAGNIIMDTNFTPCKSTIADMKSNYIYYLSAWCSANITRQGEIMKIRDNINKVKKAKYLSDIYELSNELMEII